MSSERRFNSDGEELFYDERGIWRPKRKPASEEEIKKYYARFEHPKINFYLVGITAFLLITLFIGGVILINCFLALPYSFLIMIGLYLVLFLIFINKLVIFAIRLYQFFAPMKIRERCVFTPTCSSYAIQAIKKYGVFKALPMIKSRLKRCGGPYREDPLL